MWAYVYGIQSDKTWTGLWIGFWTQLDESLPYIAYIHGEKFRCFTHLYLYCPKNFLSYQLSCVYVL